MYDSQLINQVTITLSLKESFSSLGLKANLQRRDRQETWLIKKKSW